MPRKQNKSTSFISSIWKFAVTNYFITVLVLCVGFVGVVSVYKLFIVKPTYIYVRVKVGQGLWWANTNKPNAWFVDAITHAAEEKDLTGAPTAKIVEVLMYPWYGSGQFDVYITAKLKVSKLGSGGKYNYKRATVGVASPIDFEFPGVQFSGTVIQLSTKPIVTVYSEKIVYLTKKYGFPWEYDAIQIGDSYFDGKEKVFEVLDKAMSESSDLNIAEWNTINPELIASRNYITLKVRLKGQKTGSQYIFGQEQVISAGKSLNIATSNFNFADFVVAGVEDTK